MSLQLVRQSVFSDVRSSARFRPHKLDGLEETFSDFGLRKRGRDPLPLYFPPADLAGTVSPKQGFKLSPQKRERDSVRSCIRPSSNANQLVGQAKSAEGIKIL